MITSVPSAPRVKGRRRSHDESLIKATKVYYNAGYTIRQTAERTGRSYGAVHRMLLDNGVTLRPRGGWHR